MLTSLRIKNFKSWADTGEMRLAPITGLFGANSSGKSSILKLLLLMKQTAESPDRAQVLDFGDQRTLVELGLFQEIVHQQGNGLGVEWSFGWTLPRSIDLSMYDNQNQRLQPYTEISFWVTLRDTSHQPGMQPQVDAFRCCLDHERPLGYHLCIGMRRAEFSTELYTLTYSEP